MARTLISDWVFEDEALQHAASVPILWPCLELEEDIAAVDIIVHWLIVRSLFLCDIQQLYVCTAPCQVHRTVPNAH